MTHPLVAAVAPLVERIDATLVGPEELRDTDVPLVWEGETVGGVRLAGPPQPAGDLGALLDAVAAELGAPLSSLPREQKQHAVRMLEERGAFSYRRAVEIVAEALGVTRFTVYNYLNRVRG